MVSENDWHSSKACTGGNSTFGFSPALQKNWREVSFQKHNLHEAATAGTPQEELMTQVAHHWMPFVYKYAF